MAGERRPWEALGWGVAVLLNYEGGVDYANDMLIKGERHAYWEVVLDSLLCKFGTLIQSQNGH